MPWNLSGTIIKEGRSWVDASGIRHPTNWMRWTNAEKETAGLAWVDPVAWHDNRFYHGRDSDGNLIDKNIADVNEVDENDDPVNDSDGNQIVTLGLKSVAILAIDAQARGSLAEHDWYVTRNAEKSTAIPSAVTTYRDAVRTAHTAIKSDINGAANLTAFIALYTTPVDGDGKPTGNAPIVDWPDDI